MSKIYTQLNDLFKGLIILALLINSSYIEELSGCSMYKLCSKNLLVKYIIIYLVIYISVDSNVDDSVSPIMNIKNSFILLILYIVFIRLNKELTILVSLLFLSIYLINSYKKYYDFNNDKAMKHKLEKILLYLEYITIGILIIGFLLYFNKQYKDHKKNFKLSKFIFGVLECGK